MASGRILGIDPGSRRTGFGIIDTDGYRSTLVCQGVIRVEQYPFLLRLHRISAAIGALCNDTHPTHVSIESPFVGKNIRSALKLGQALGAAIAGALENREIGICEYAPREIKLVVTGSGDADKALVQHYVRAILCLSEALSEDAADALAIALCHAHSNPDWTSRLPDGAVLPRRQSRRRGRGLRF